MNRLPATISGVHGTHVFLQDDSGVRYYAHRDQLSFSDPFIGLRVLFENGGTTHGSAKLRALNVQKADGVTVRRRLAGE